MLHWDNDTFTCRDQGAEPQRGHPERSGRVQGDLRLCRSLGFGAKPNHSPAQARAAPSCPEDSAFCCSSGAKCRSFVLPVCHTHARTLSLPHTEPGSDLSSAGEVQSSCLSSFILHKTRGFKVLQALFARHTQSGIYAKKSATKLHFTKFFPCSKRESG